MVNRIVLACTVCGETYEIASMSGDMWSTGVSETVKRAIEKEGCPSVERDVFYRRLLSRKRILELDKFYTKHSKCAVEPFRLVYKADCYERN